MTNADWIAADWGTTNLRIWAMRENGSVLEARRSDRGMGKLRPDAFEDAFMDLAGDLIGPGPCEVVICGMAGARQGWTEAPYAPLPWRPEDPHAIHVETRDPRLSVRVLPGLAQSEPPDVMRGEETQIAGVLSRTPDFTGIICLPGTHTKWVSCSKGEVQGFRTAMTGELFDLLSRHSILRHGIGEGWDDAAFLSGVEDGFKHPERLTGDLFGIRAAGLLAGLSPDATRARLSGLLIGTELAAQDHLIDAGDLTLVGAPAVCEHYEIALRWRGVAPSRADAAQMTLLGLTAAYRDLTG